MGFQQHRHPWQDRRETCQAPGSDEPLRRKIYASPAKLTVSNAKVNLLDAALTVDGFLESPAKAPLGLDLTASGAIGAQMTEWVSRQINWPKQLMLRSPLQVNKGRVIWREGGDVAFQGSLTIAGGPQLSIDLVQGLQTVEAKQIMITDGRQSARMTLNLKKDNFAFSFNGTLEQETLNRIFQVTAARGEPDPGRH